MFYAPHVRGSIKLPIYRLAEHVSQCGNTDEVTAEMQLCFWAKINGLLKRYCQARNDIISHDPFGYFFLTNV